MGNSRNRVLTALAVLAIGLGYPATAFSQASTQPRSSATATARATVTAPAAVTAPATVTAPAAVTAPATSAHGCGGASAAGTPVWPEFGGDNSHSQDGVQVATRAGALHRRWETAQLDGAMYGEPLVADGCVYAATENDSIYAFNASSGALVWHVHLASPVTGGIACAGDINPSGITGTPVVDTAHHELWAVVFTDVSGRPQHEIVAVDSRNGHLLRRQAFALPGTDPTAEQQRSALVLEHGNVYVALGGLYGDCGNYKGGVVAVPEAAGHSLGYWSTPTAREGAVWEVAGPDVLPDGNLLLSTGNSAASPGQRFDGGDAILQLTDGLHVSSYFAPTQWAQWNVSDQDIGSSAPALVANGLAVQVGKSGEGFLVSTSHLGGIGGQLAATQVCSGGGAYGADAVSGLSVYVPCSNGITAVGVHGHSLRVLWRSNVGGAGSVLVAGGRVFEQTQGGQLFAVSSASGQALQTVSLGAPVTHFPWLVAVSNTLYAADGTRLVAFSGV